MTICTLVLRLLNKNVNAILGLLERDLTRLQAPLSSEAGKFVSAAEYGELVQSVEKCENRYQCPVKLDMVQKMLPFQY